MTDDEIIEKAYKHMLANPDKYYLLIDATHWSKDDEHKDKTPQEFENYQKEYKAALSMRDNKSENYHKKYGYYYTDKGTKLTLDGFKLLYKDSLNKYVEAYRQSDAAHNLDRLINENFVEAEFATGIAKAAAIFGNEIATLATQTHFTHFATLGDEERRKNIYHELLYRGRENEIDKIGKDFFGGLYFAPYIIKYNDVGVPIEDIVTTFLKNYMVFSIFKKIKGDAKDIPFGEAFCVGPDSFGHMKTEQQMYFVNPTRLTKLTIAKIENDLIVFNLSKKALFSPMFFDRASSGLKPQKLNLSVLCLTEPELVFSNEDEKEIELTDAGKAIWGKFKELVELSDLPGFSTEHLIQGLYKCIKIQKDKKYNNSEILFDDNEFERFKTKIQNRNRYYNILLAYCETNNGQLNKTAEEEVRRLVFDENIKLEKFSDKQLNQFSKKIAETISKQPDHHTLKLDFAKLQKEYTYKSLVHRVMKTLSKPFIKPIKNWVKKRHDDKSKVKPISI